MKIVDLNNRIMFQKKVLQFDELHRQVEQWNNFFSCWSNLRVITSTEEEKNAVTKRREIYLFTVRKIKELRELNSLEYRIVFNDKVFDIIEVDMFEKERKYLYIRGVFRDD